MTMMLHCHPRTNQKLNPYTKSVFQLSIVDFTMLLMQSTGGFIAVARYASATPLPPSILSRGVGWQVNNQVLVVIDLPDRSLFCFD